MHIPLKSLPLALALSLSFAVPAAAQQPCDCAIDRWEVSLTPSEQLPFTEVRAFVEWGGKLMAAVGAWMDQGPVKGSAKILRLDSSDGHWQVEVDFGGVASTTGAMAPLHWTARKNGAPTDTWTLVASTWNGANTYTRNELDLKWYKTDFGAGQIRSFGTHDDKIAREYLGFAGGKPGVIRGQLADSYVAGKSPIEWVTGPDGIELDTVDLHMPNCTGDGRVMGFAESKGKLYAIACWDLFVRIDGPRGACAPNQVNTNGDQCQPRWKDIWSDPLAQSSESGLRGITAITHTDGNPMLLIGSENANAHVTRIDGETPQTAIVEFNAKDFVDQLWGLNSGYKFIPINSPANVWYGPDGVARRLFGFETWLPGSPAPNLARNIVSVNGDPPSTIMGEGMFFVREPNARYTLHRIPPITPKPMQAIRDCRMSPFKDECDANGRDCKIYCGGFDGNSSVVQTPCYAAPCTTPHPHGEIPTHNTGFIVKGRISSALSATGTAAQSNEKAPPRHAGD